MRRRVLRSNCFLFAWWLYLGPWRGVGYCAIRRVKPPLPIGWHWVFIPFRRPMRTVHFEPVERKSTWWAAAIHKLWFRGRIRRYDFPWGTNRTR